MKTILTLVLSLIVFQANSSDKQRANLLLSVNNDKVSKFLNKHYDISRKLWLEHEVPMCISLAMWGLESAWGTYPPAIEANNLGGIMTRDKKLKKFDTLDDFFEDYKRILTGSCYQKINRYSIREWLNALSWKECHYASSRRYPQKLLTIIFKRNLDLLI